MQQTAGDGLPVNYSPYPTQPGFGGYGATQTVGNPFGLNFGGEPSAALSSSSGSKVTHQSGGLVLTPASDQLQGSSSSETSPIDFQGGSFSQFQGVSPADLSLRSNNGFPTPPPASIYETGVPRGLEHLNSSSLPMSSFTSGLGGSNSSNLTNTGSGQWQASHPEQSSLSQPAWSMPGHRHSQGMSQTLPAPLGMTPSSSGAHYTPPMGTPAYGTPSFHQSNQMEMEPNAAYGPRGEGSMLPGLDAQSPLQPMPQHIKLEAGDEEFGTIQFEAGKAEDEASRGPLGRGDQPEEEDGDRAAENLPYAQLIWKAFMSRPDHTMTLQEIYQWFRNNTDKTQGEGKGWQNSIRHNLSMNAAFCKEDRQASPGDNSQESKKSSAWKLEDWAVDGVQSTTRYRPKNNTSTRRSGGGSAAQQRRQENTVARATAGGRGITTPNRSRTAVPRRAAPSRVLQPDLLGAQAHQQMPYAGAEYPQQVEYPQLQVSGEMYPSLQARNMEGVGSLFSQNMPSGIPVGSLQTPGSGQEYTYGGGAQGHGIPDDLQRPYHQGAYNMGGGHAGGYPGQPQPARNNSQELSLMGTPAGYGDPFNQDNDEYAGFNNNNMNQQYQHH
ncbi:hypothetical protein F5Y17DRAFT_463621 [Xylariaceae sp. FL0594]|nr:hypothetical protein F5Y17DRAFT_463621 [Xylariaceae sp. FL0594]